MICREAENQAPHGMVLVASLSVREPMAGALLEPSDMESSSARFEAEACLAWAQALERLEYKVRAGLRQRIISLIPLATQVHFRR